MTDRAAADPGPTLVFRLPLSAHLAVVFLLFSVLPLALANGGGDQGGPAGLTWRLALLLIPVVAAVFIARTATIVGPKGFRVRATFGSRSVPWDDVRGLSLAGRSIYLVLRDGGALRLPCIRVPDLAAISRASGGRLPEIPEAPRKYAPSQRRRGRR